jgi:peptide/nickel transport system permease protein
VTALRARLGLDRSPPEQYAAWVGRALRGDLGVSYASRQPVAREFFDRLPATLQLAGAAVLLTAVLGFGGGLLAALRRGGWPDRLTWLLALLGASVPAYLLGLLLGWLFGVRLGWLPVAGSGSWQHLVLPALTLALGAAALQARLLRAGLLGALAEPFANTARAKGLSPGGVLRRHALPRAAGPSLQALGLAAAQLLAGAVVVETVFAWPGVGKLAVDSIARRDYPMVQAYVLVVGAGFVLVNLATDLLHAAVDPTARVTLRGREGDG